MKKKIFVVDDEEDIRTILRLYLENAGFDVLEARDGQEAFDRLQGLEISLMILDIMMPRVDGFSLIRKLGEKRTFPILFLSAKNKVEDKILGLNLGGDDYMEKPFDPSELVARVMAILRRYPGPVEKKILRNGNLSWDKEKRHIYQEGKRLDLTAKEYLLLAKFLKRPGKVFTKSELYEEIWQEPYLSAENTIMVHISKLRDKIEKDPKKPEIIKTIRGIGYTMVERPNHEEV